MGEKDRYREEMDRDMGRKKNRDMGRKKDRDREGVEEQ